MTKWIAGLCVLAALGAAGCASTDTGTAGKSSSASTTDDTQTTVSDDTPDPVTPEPNGKYELNCDYNLEFDPDFNGNDHHTFIAGGELINTGNIGIVVRVKYKWRLLGQDPLIVTKRYKVKRGHTREINVSLPASSEQIDAHQSADSACSTKVDIVDTFGRAK